MILKKSALVGGRVLTGYQEPPIRPLIRLHGLWGVYPK